MVTKDLSISPRFLPYDFLSRCKFSTLTTRQLMVEFYLPTFSRFPLRTPEYKYFDKNRTQDLHTINSRCARLPTRSLGRRGDSQANRYREPAQKNIRHMIVFISCFFAREESPKNLFSRFLTAVMKQKGGLLQKGVRTPLCFGAKKVHN